MSDYRIPKISADGGLKGGQQLTPIERKAAIKQKNPEKSEKAQKMVSKRAIEIRMTAGDVDLMQFHEDDGRNVTVESERKEIKEKVCEARKVKKKKSWSENVTINGRSIKMKVDSGSTVTILTLKDFSRLGLRESCLEPTRSTIITYSGNKIVPLGKMRAGMTLRGRTVLAKILVIEEASTSLLGFPEGLELGLFRIDHGLIAQKLDEFVDECLSGKDRSENDEVPYSIQELPPCKFKVSLQMKDGARPKILAPRRLPLAIREKTKMELDRMVQLGVISPVNEPREWCHQMVVADKPNGAVRVCLDPRLLNQFIRREEFQIPDFDALASELTEAKIYSTIDLLSGFWQFGLDEESKKLLTFATPFGRYQYNRLPFGLSCAPEMFHKRVVETLAGIPGVLVYIDDILIWGRTKEEHDERLRMVLKRLEEMKFSVNPKKCHFSQDKVKFLGHMIQDGTLSVDPEKVRAIREMPSPVDRKGLKRVIGMLSFVRKFIPDYNELISPFRGLLKERTAFIWTETEEAAMDRIRESDLWIKSLALFKPGKPVTLLADASSYGLGAVLLQEDRPVYYCSRTMTEMEETWAQIDKEFLAMTWALERLDLFTYGQKVRVLTDHKPLLGLIVKPMDHCSIRQQRLLGRIMRYDIDLQYVPGKDLAIADALSRGPMKRSESEPDKGFMGTDLHSNEVFVSECTTRHGLSDFSYTENSDRNRAKILVAASKCEEYQETIRAWYEGWNPAAAEKCGEYWKVRDEIFESEGLLFYQGRTIIPRALRDKYLRGLHCSHGGINSTLRRAKGIWWPKIEQEVKEFVKGCAMCQSQADRQRKEPMQSFEIPRAPGLVIASDHFFLGGKAYVLFTDIFSMWTEFYRVQTTSGGNLIRALRQYIARNGIPRVITADQGTAYTGSEFKEFCDDFGIHGCVGSAKYSQGNAHAEAAVKRVKKWLKRCASEDELCRAILAWHQTPVAEGRPSPAEIHLGRNVRDDLTWRVEQTTVDWEEVRIWRESRNAKAKKYYDSGARPLADLEPQEKVFIWDNVLKSWIKGVVLEKLSRPRSYRVQTAEGAVIERNRRDLKPDRSWHSRTELKTNLGAFQECRERAIGRGDAEPGRGDAHGIWRGYGVNGGTGERVDPSVAGNDGRAGERATPRLADPGWTRTRSSSTGTDRQVSRGRSGERAADAGDDQRPVHGSPDAGAARFSRGAQRHGAVRPTRGEEDVDGGGELADEGGRPSRVKKRPRKYDDFVLY
jgi:anti-sigma28 factor (negative regulator of flagellin synthesis)